MDEAKEQRIEFLEAGEDAPEALQSPEQPSGRHESGYDSARWQNRKMAKKPVLVINTATYWYAMRANGFDELGEGFGSLLTDFSELPAS